MPPKKKPAEAQEVLEPTETPVVESEAASVADNSVTEREGPTKRPEGIGTDAVPALRGTVEHPSDLEPPPSTEIVVSEADPYRVMDQQDEEMILETLQGRMLGTMLYSFKQGKENVTDLSYAGVLEAVRSLNGAGHSIHIAAEPRPVIEEIVEEDDTYFRVVVYAKDDRTGMAQFGLAKQAKHKKLRDGSLKRDFFAETIALNKAQRNALRVFVPEGWRQTLIAQYLKDPSKIRRIKAGPGAEKLAELPPPLDTPEAEAKRAEAREIYMEIREIDPVKILPGAFNAMLVRHEWSLERLDELIASLRDRLAETQEGEEKEKGDEDHG